MATLSSVLGNISGKLSEMIHARIVNGKNILAKNPIFNLRKWLTDSRYARSRENTYNFTAESKVTSTIYRGLHKAAKLAGPYAHNAILAHIAPLFSKGLFGGRHATHIDADIVARHMLALDISPAAIARKKKPAKYLSIDPETHNPSLQGGSQLVNLPNPATIKANEVLAYRVHTIHVTVPFMDWVADLHTYEESQNSRSHAVPEERRGRAPMLQRAQTHSEPWLSWDKSAIPQFPTTTRAQVLQNPNAVKQASQDQPTITFTIIEWRASTGNRHRFLRDATTFFVSGVTLSRHATIDLLIHAPNVQLTAAQIESKHIRQHKLMPHSFAPAQESPIIPPVHFLYTDQPVALEQPESISNASLEHGSSTQVTPKIPQISTIRPLSPISSGASAAIRKAGTPSPLAHASKPWAKAERKAGSTSKPT